MRLPKDDTRLWHMGLGDRDMTDFIRTTLQERDVPQSHFAERVGCSANIIGTGDYALPRPVDKPDAIARGLNLPVHVFRTKLYDPSSCAIPRWYLEPVQGNLFCVQQCPVCLPCNGVCNPLRADFSECQNLLCPCRTPVTDSRRRDFLEWVRLQFEETGSE